MLILLHTVFLSSLSLQGAPLLQSVPHVLSVHTLDPQVEPILRICILLFDNLIWDRRAEGGFHLCFNTGTVVCTPCGTGTYYGSTGIYLLLSFIYTGLYCHLRLLFLLLFICISLYCHLESTLAYSWGNVELNFARPTRGHERNMQPREKERWMGIPKALPVFNGRRFLLCCLCRLSSWIIFRF